MGLVMYGGRRGGRRRRGKEPTNSVLSGILSSGAVGLISLASGIVVLPFIVAQFGAGHYGVWLVCVAGATYLYYADLGIGVSIIHFSSRIRGGDERTTHVRLLSSGILWTGPLTVVIAAASFFLSLWYTRQHDHTQNITAAESRTMVACAVVLALGLLLRPFSATLVGLGHLTVERKYQLAGVGVRLLGTLTVCVGTASFSYLVLVETAALLLPSSLAALDVVFTRGVRPTPRQAHRRELRMMFGYGTKSFAVNAMGAVVLQAGTVLCGLVASPSDVTYYNAALRIYQGVRQVLTWVTEPFRPALSRIFVDHRMAEHGTRIAQASMFAAFVFTGCVFVVFVIIGELLVRWWLGPDVPTEQIFHASSLLLFGLVLNSLHIPLVSTLDAAGFPGRFFPYQAAWAAAFIGAGTVLGAEYGFTGVAFALGAPLVILEPLYIISACRVLPLLRRGMLSRVLVPGILLLIVPAMVLALGALVIGSNADTWSVGISAALYLSVLSLTAYCFRARLPLSDIISAIRTPT